MVPTFTYRIGLTAGGYQEVDGAAVDTAGRTLIIVDANGAAVATYRPEEWTTLAIRRAASLDLKHQDDVQP